MINCEGSHSVPSTSRYAPNGKQIRCVWGKKYMKKTLLIGLSASVFSACSVNPVTERSQLSLVPEQTVIAQSALAYSGLMQNELSRGKLNADSTQLARIRNIAFEVIPYAVAHKPEIINWKWEVNLVESGEVNAFCMAGGKIAVYSGLISKLNPTDDELAQVISHEIAHALSGHTQEKMSVALVGQVAANLAQVAARSYGYNIDPNATGALLQVAWLLPNSRQAEAEADQIGIKLAALAGYDPMAATTLWKKMQAINEHQTISILSTHPAPEEREIAMREEAEKLAATYKKATLRKKAGAQPKIEYVDGKPTNLFGKATYTDPKQP